MQPAHSSLLITTLCFSLMACGPATLQPQPSTSANATNRLQVQLSLHNPERQPAAGVSVQLSTLQNTVAELTSDSQGEVLLSNLDAQQPYLLDISHPDFVSIRRQLDLRELPTESALKLGLSRWVQRLGGRVLDAQGQPLAEVNLQAGDAVSVSNAEGHFVLYTTVRASRLQAFRQGYALQELPLDTNHASDLSINLSAANAPRRLRLDDAWQPLGQPATTQAETWSGALADAQAQGYELLAWEAEALDPARDMLWLRSPAQALDDARQEEVEAFVLAGGKLWVNTEWAGFGGFDQQSVQRLLARFGVAAGKDSLRSASGWTVLQVSDFAPHYLTQNLEALNLANAASVGLYQPAQGALLAWSAGDIFRILQQRPAPQGLLAVQYAGLGKVGVLGDSSLWLSPNGAYEQADHRALWLRCLSW
ncbi:MAG: carboxypeptidase regulatory-like domain-containing protein [Candidatus Sericytochromatia bacterium]|nr:carboxypeptidase regulatory-like domain-containing protein [Candidatus Sericytochromatia bacterium]